MKSLKEYIIESSEEEVVDSKSFTFNFNGIEDTDDFFKSLEDKECVTIEDGKVTVNVSKDCEECAKTFELIQDFIQLRGKSQKRASDEQYAQKLHKLEAKLSQWSDFIDEEDKEDEEDNDKDSKEDKNKEEE